MFKKLALKLTKFIFFHTQNPFKKIRELAVFLGVAEKYTDDQIRSLVGFTSFESMRNNPGFNNQFMVDINVFKKEMEFFHTGKVGNWRKYFTAEMSDKVDKMVQEKLKTHLLLDYGAEP
jgi:hypothetical protein